MASVATIIKKTKSETSLMLYYGLICSILASLVLSAEAITCHQCNSHMDKDCTLAPPVDQQYLKPCVNRPGFDTFCRKTVVTIEATGEHRIVRGCGWLHLDGKSDYCFSADNEGYLQTICTCDVDGCNAAPSVFNNYNIIAIVTLLGVLIMLSNQLRSSF